MRGVWRQYVIGSKRVTRGLGRYIQREPHLGRATVPGRPVAIKENSVFRRPGMVALPRSKSGAWEVAPP